MPLPVGDARLKPHRKAEARHLLTEQVRELQAQSRDDLLSLLNAPKWATLRGPSGTEFQVEVQAFWDDRPGEDLRVMVSIDDGGWRAFVPLTDGFIVRPAQ
jgi:hypothetical protein